MKYFPDVFGSLKKQMAGRDLFLFLDFDGTMTPIVDHHEKAMLSQTTRCLLEKLAALPFFNISIISGRALWDLRNKVGPVGITYIGNHGLEIDAPGVNFKGFDLLHTREIIEYLKHEINKELMFFKGAFIEDKIVTLSVHYRKVDDSKAPILRIFLNELTQRFIERHQIRVAAGKKVFEIKPPIDWDKGKAVLWLLDQYRHDHGNLLPIYIGDDVTDEDAFRALKGRGITIKVGNEGDSSADYYLKGQKEVIGVLKELVELNREVR